MHDNNSAVPDNASLHDRLPWSPDLTPRQPIFPLSGGDRYRDVLDQAAERRRAGRAELDPYASVLGRHEEKVESTAVNPGPPHSAEWVVAVLAGLYGEATRKGFTGFYGATCWVVRTADERLNSADFSAVPLHLLLHLYRVLNPRGPLGLLWRHPGRPFVPKSKRQRTS